MMPSSSSTTADLVTKELSFLRNFRESCILVHQDQLFGLRDIFWVFHDGSATSRLVLKPSSPESRASSVLLPALVALRDILSFS